MSRAHPGGVLAAFRHLDAAVDAVKSLKEQGYEDFTVYSPAPLHEVLDAVGHKVSPVRLWTLFGGLLGVTAGYAMTLWMSYDWPLVVGGKPVGSEVPYTVIAFELTVLIGALFTVTGVLVHIIYSQLKKPAPFDPRFSNDHIGIFVPCAEGRRSAVQDLLTSAGAEEVRVEA